MELGCRMRRTASGFTILTIVALGGCHAMPVAGIAPSPNRPQSTLASAGRAALLPATVAMDPPSEMSSIEPVASSASSLTPAEPVPEASGAAPTPLLDAALQKVRGIDEIIASEMARSSTPPPLPATFPQFPSPIPNPSPPTVQLPPVNPPKVEPVTVSSAVPQPSAAPVEPKAKEAEPERPEDLWREGVRKLSSLARAKLGQSGDSTTPWSLRSRILSWLAEPDIDPELGQRETDGVRAVLRALDEPASDSPRRGDDVRSAVLAIEDKAPFEIVDLRLCSKVEKFGDFEPFEPPVRKAGQQIILYCEVDGLRFEQTSAGFRTRTFAQVEILPEGGGPPIRTWPLGVAEETCRRRRRDYYIAYKLTLPRPIAPGDYRIRLTEKDITSDRSTTREVAFAIARD